MLITILSCFVLSEILRNCKRPGPCLVWGLVHSARRFKPHEFNHVVHLDPVPCFLRTFLCLNPSPPTVHLKFFHSGITRILLFFRAPFVKRFFSPVCNVSVLPFFPLAVFGDGFFTSIFSVPLRSLLFPWSSNRLTHCFCDFR